MPSANLLNLAEARSLSKASSLRRLPKPTLSHKMRQPGDQPALANLRRDVAGMLTIGSTGGFGTSFASELPFAFRKRFPQMKIDAIPLSESFLSAPALRVALLRGRRRPPRTQALNRWSIAC